MPQAGAGVGSEDLEGHADRVNKDEVTTSASTNVGRRPQRRISVLHDNRYFKRHAVYC